MNKYSFTVDLFLKNPLSDEEVRNLRDEIGRSSRDKILEGDSLEVRTLYTYNPKWIRGTAPTKGDGNDADNVFRYNETFGEVSAAHYSNVSEDEIWCTIPENFDFDMHNWEDTITSP